MKHTNKHKEKRLSMLEIIEMLKELGITDADQVATIVEAIEEEERC